MQDQLDKAREHALAQVLKCQGPFSADGRNWATVYAILTDKKIAECSVRQWVGADGATHTQDAYGHPVADES